MMINLIKKTINGVLGLIGLKLSKVRHDAPHQIVRGLRANGIDVVFDVGANTGQFAKAIRDAGFTGRIVCFEPLPDAHAGLRKRFESDERVVVPDRTALGDEQGSIRINVSQNSVSSSILNLLPTHADAAPDSVYVDAVDTPIDRLDNVYDRYVSEGEKAFLKIDTQGYEWNVLDGAEDALGRIDGLLLEMSLVPLYDGQRLWKDLLHRLEHRGFALWQILPGFFDPATAQSLQFDGVFYRDQDR